jgi:hypothetical protein
MAQRVIRFHVDGNAAEKKVAVSFNLHGESNVQVDII